MERPFFQSSRQLLIYAIEAAVRENGDNVTGLKLSRQLVDDGNNVGMQFGGGSTGVERAHNVFWVQALGIWDELLLVDAGKNDAISKAKTLDEILLEHFAPQRV